MYERGGGEAGAETEEGRIGISDMQEVAAREFSEIAGKLSEDFAIRLKVKEETKSPAQEEETEEEFSFSNAFGDRSPVAAEDVFEDGWIRPVFPLFNRELLLSDEDLRPPVKKLFVKEEEEEEEEEEEAEGPYCEWDGKKAVVREAAATTKSNSTGFSKLWRLRERTMRSNSDGKDAFVFLSGAGDEAKPEKTTKKKKVVMKKKKKKSAKVATSSFSAHYATSRAKKEEDKRVSYLPYRVGFFANVSGGMSRNVHPF